MRTVLLAVGSSGDHRSHSYFYCKIVLRLFKHVPRFKCNSCTPTTIWIPAQSPSPASLVEDFVALFLRILPIQSIAPSSSLRIPLPLSHFRQRSKLPIEAFSCTLQANANSAASRPMLARNSQPRDRFHRIIQEELQTSRTSFAPRFPMTPPSHLDSHSNRVHLPSEFVIRKKVQMSLPHSKFIVFLSLSPISNNGRSFR